MIPITSALSFFRLRALVWRGLLSLLTVVIANGQEKNLLRNGSFEFPVSRTN